MARSDSRIHAGALLGMTHSAAAARPAPEPGVVVAAADLPPSRGLPLRLPLCLGLPPPIRRLPSCRGLPPLFRRLLLCWRASLLSPRLLPSRRLQLLVVLASASLMSTAPSMEHSM